MSTENIIIPDEYIKKYISFDAIRTRIDEINNILYGKNMDFEKERGLGIEMEYLFILEAKLNEYNPEGIIEIDDTYF